MNRKRFLRKEIFLKLSNISREERKRSSGLVCERIANGSLFKSAERIIFYDARRHELCLKPLVDISKSEGKGILWPRVVGEDLEFVACEKYEDLVPGAFGILTPPITMLGVSLKSSDLILIPGLAFDRRGVRLGSGKGFFDRALSRPTANQALRCGIGYEFQWLSWVPQEAWDLRVDTFISPDKTRKPENWR